MTLVKTLSPILALTADEAWQVMRAAKLVDSESVHLSDWPPLSGAVDEELEQRWARWLALRDVVMKALETERMQQVIGSPLEAKVTIVTHTPEMAREIETHRDALAEAFVVSEIAAVNGQAAPGQAVEHAELGIAQIHVERAPGAKCQRCWKHLRSVGADATHPQLCARCVAALRTGNS